MKDKVHCVYKNCKMGCKNSKSHRAKYAYISQAWREKVSSLNKEIEEKRVEGKSPLINYDVLKKMGIFYHIN